MKKHKEMIKNLKYAFWPSLIISLLLTLGYSTKHYQGIVLSWNGVICTIGLTITLSVILGGTYWLIGKGKTSPAVPVLNRIYKKTWFFFFLVYAYLVVVWMPLFFAFYPGIFAYDAQWQYAMYITKEVSTHQPIIHTYLLGSVIDTFYRLTGSINKGIAAYFLVQMFLMALGCSFAIYKLYSWKCKTWILVFAMLFYGFYPVFTIFVFTSTKDSFFSIVVVNLILLLIELIENNNLFWESKLNWFSFVTFNLLLLMLRNNAIYPTTMCLPFLIALIIKEKAGVKKGLASIACIIGLYLIYKYPLVKALSSEEVSKAEMLSAPCQQIMRVYKYHDKELLREEIDIIEALFDGEKWYGYYVPEIADATKGSLRIDVYENDPSLFWNLWVELLKRYPKEYTDSFLENTYGFWYPWPHYIIYSFGGEGYTPILTMQPGEQNSKIPGLLEVYKNFENGQIVQSKYLISWIFAPATYMYMALAVMFYVLKERKYKYMIIFGFLMLLWCTYLLGPVAMVRYALYLYALVPVWLAVLSCKNRNMISS